MLLKSQAGPFREQVSERKSYPASIGAASRKVAQYAFLSTAKGVKTPGDKTVMFGALTGIIAFFLPWIAIVGPLSGSGLRIALHASGWFWLYPASMILCFVVSFKNADYGEKRMLWTISYIVIGTLWFGPSMAAVCNAFSGVVGMGGYLVAASAGAILVSGLLRVSERLHNLSTTG